MGNRFFLLGLVTLLLLAMSTGGLAADKLKMGTAARENPYYTLIVIAGEEKGFWKQNGLEQEWTPFRGGADMQRATAAGALDVGLSDMASFLIAAAAGVPSILVADMGTPDDFAVVVRSDLPIKEAKDLKGTRLGILRAGGASYAYGTFLAKALGLEKDMKLVAGGGITEELAAIKAGTMEGRVTALTLTMPAIVKGEVRTVVQLKDYLPKEWIVRVASARRELVENSPDLVKRFVKAFLQTTNFIMTNPAWNIAKMKTELKYSDEVAKATLPMLRLSLDGRIDRKAVENVVGFFVENGVLAKEKVPPVERLFTSRFTD